jgi:hypothetical protein
MSLPLVCCAGHLLKVGRPCAADTFRRTNFGGDDEDDVSAMTVVAHERSEDVAIYQGRSGTRDSYD